METIDDDTRAEHSASPLDDDARDRFLCSHNRWLFSDWKASGAPPYTAPSNQPTGPDDVVCFFGVLGTRSQAFTLCLHLEMPRLARDVLSTPGLTHCDPEDWDDFHQQVSLITARLLHSCAPPDIR